MSKGKVKHLFPGGNTPLGFFSYYDNILSQEDAKRILVIKGGPGVGKSTFMKKIGAEMLDRGYDVEFMHCSSDNNSLDGVVIPAIKVALLDGTAPHVVDPKSPGAVDEIINFGDFWNEEGMRSHKESILKETKEIGRHFARAYRYLKGGAAIHEDSSVIYGWALNTEKVNAVTANLINEFFNDKDIAIKEGRVRNIFASAITPDGLKNYLDTVLTTGKVYEIKSNLSTNTRKILDKLKAASIEAGCYTEAFYCPMDPNRIEHLVLPELDVSFTTTNTYHQSDVKKYAAIDLDEYLDADIIKTHKDILEQNRIKFEELLKMAIGEIYKAKTIHDHLETYYIPNIDFDAVQLCLESTISRILEYARE